jgi:predicted nucleotidyltransferase
MALRIDIDHERIAEFCRENRIRKLSFFGSVIRDDFAADSDVDVLVDFQPDAGVGLLEMAQMQIELAEILGREVDFKTAGFLSRYFRDQVLEEAVEEYVA